MPRYSCFVMRWLMIVTASDGCISSFSAANASRCLACRFFSIYNKETIPYKTKTEHNREIAMKLILDNADTIIFIMELIGTVAFASSGTLTALKQDMDIFGVNVLAIVTAVGGGVIRDLIIGRTPPVMFLRPVYALVAMATCNLLFLIFYCNRRLLESSFIVTYEKLMLLLDAVGLGIFTVTGVSAGMGTSYSENFFLVTFLGVITGVGGGVLRDVLAIQKPYILVKHVYACASILGACACILLWPHGNIPAMWAGAAIVLIIRVCAMVFKWNLPKLKRV